MKQVLQATRGGNTRLAEVQPPTLRPEGLLVRTEWSLISAGTERLVIDLAKKSLLGKARQRPDLVQKTLEKLRREGLLATYRTVSGRLASDLPLGYSCAGRVLEVGSRVSDIAVGDRVACAGAGYANHAELNFVPRNLAARLPEGLDTRRASAATLAAIALHGVRTADLRLGEIVVVIGLGLLGQLAVRMLRASGVRVVAVDLDPERARLAREGGAEIVVSGGEDPEPAVLGASQGHGADAALVCAASDSSEPIALAARLCRRGGVVTLVGATGMDLDRRSFYERELSLRMSTSYGPGRYDPAYEERGLDYPYPYVRWTEGRNLEAVLRLIRDGALDLDPLLSHEFAIEEAESAYALVTGESTPFLGVLLRYGDSPLAEPPTPAPRLPAAGELRLGVAGAGQFATAVLLPALQGVSQLRLSALATASGSSADAVQRRFGFARSEATAEALIDAEDVDAVVVATRHDSHARLVARCLAAGKPCFVEKPLAIREEELEELDEAMRARPGLVCVGFNRRFAPAVRVLREKLAGRSSPFHAHYRVNAGRLPAGHWTLDREVGGGRILGEACHFVDLLAHLAGAACLRLQAQPVGADGVAALLRFADGSSASLEYLSGSAASLPKEGLEVHWQGRSYEIDDFCELRLRDDSAQPTRLWRGAQDKGHRAEIRAWAQALREGRPSPVPFAEAMASTRATFAIERALRSGAAVELEG